jgi:hypothetical protein
MKCYNEKIEEEYKMIDAVESQAMFHLAEKTKPENIMTVTFGISNSFNCNTFLIKLELSRLFHGITVIPDMLEVAKNGLSE